MQEHSGQVRGQARAPVGRYGGGWLWTRWTLRFPYDSTTPHPPFPTSALYRRHQSTQLTPAVACARWAHGLERACGQRCAFLCTCHFQRTLSSSFSNPNRKVPCFYWTMETSGGVSCPSPPPHSCPFHAASWSLFPALPGPCVWIHRKGPGRTVALSFQDPSVSYHANTVHKRTQHYSAPSSVVGRFPHLFSLDDHRLRIESAV